MDDGEGTCTTVSLYEDADGDGVGAGDAFDACLDDPMQPPPRTATIGGDCDDNLATASSLITGYADADGDGVTVSAPTELCLPALPDGFVATANPEDCNDNDPGIAEPKTFYADVDDDGYGDAGAPMMFCSATPPDGYAIDASDPDDGNPQITPLDADGDLVADDNDCAPMDSTKWTTATVYADGDGDMHTFGPGQSACIGAAPPMGYTLAQFGNDCDDDDPTVAVALSAYVDADLDCVGAGSLVSVCAATLPAGYATSTGDVCPTDATATATPHTTPDTAAGARIDEDIVDTTDWSFLGTSPYASLINLPSRVNTEWLRMRQFGFALPGTAKILGITARINRVNVIDSQEPTDARDLEIRLYHGGSRTLVNRALSSQWSQLVIEGVAYGGAADLWGRVWTAAEINSINFGIGVRAQLVNFPDPDDNLAGTTIQVREVAIAVTYCAQ